MASALLRTESHGAMEGKKICFSGMPEILLQHYTVS